MDTYIRLFVLARKHMGPERQESSSSGLELRGLQFAIVHAIALSPRGFTRIRESNESVSGIEVFLPRLETPRMAPSGGSEHQHTLLLTGWLTEHAE